MKTLTTLKIKDPDYTIDALIIWDGDDPHVSTSSHGIYGACDCRYSLPEFFEILADKLSKGKWKTVSVDGPIPNVNITFVNDDGTKTTSHAKEFRESLYYKSLKSTTEGFNKVMEEFDRQIKGIFCREATPQETSKAKTEPTFRIESIEVDGKLYAQQLFTGTTPFSAPEGYLVHQENDNLSHYHFILDLLKRGGTIKSVKRLSDGEVFSVGEVVICEGRDSYKIENFCISGKDDSMWVGLIPTDECLLLARKSMNLEFSEDCIQKAYKVEDGWISYDTEVWVVYSTFNMPNSKFRIAVPENIPQNQSKYFKSKENAEKYIKENKPLYSEKDMKDWGTFFKSHLIDFYCFDKDIWGMWKNRRKEKE